MATKKKAKKKAAKAKTKRKPNAAFMKPVKPDAKLAAVVGSKAIAADRGHQEAVGVHQAERPAGQEEPPQINADAALLAVFEARTRSTMFEMTKLVSKHLS